MHARAERRWNLYHVSKPSFADILIANRATHTLPSLASIYLFLSTAPLTVIPRLGQQICKIFILKLSTLSRNTTMFWRTTSVMKLSQLLMRPPLLLSSKPLLEISKHTCKFPCLSIEILLLTITLLIFSASQKDRKSTRLNSSHSGESRMPSSA